jgi:chromosome partitioning protein
MTGEGLFAILGDYMGYIVVFANQKGGVGKTTSAVNLGAYVAEAGKRVLLVDFDPQGNLSSSVGQSTEGVGIYELINSQSTPAQATFSTSVENLWIIPSSINLTGANIELVEEERREFFLKDVLSPLAEQYDYVFVDCPPSLGILTLNGLVAAHKVIIPLQCEYFAMEGLTQLLQTIKRVQGQYNSELDILGILFTMYDSRTRLAQDVVQEVIGYFGKRVFRTIIPRNIRLSEAPSHGVPVNQYDGDCAGAKSYRKLSEEVIARG